MAITEHGHANSFAEAMKCAKELKKAGRDFKYIPGCEFYIHPDLTEWQKLKEEHENNKKKKKVIENDSGGDGIEDENATRSQKWLNPLNRRHHLVVLPKNQKGLDSLFGLVSFGYNEGKYRFPRIDMQELERKSNGNLIALTACLGGPFSYEMFKHCADVEWDDVTHELVKSREGIILPHLENLADQYVESVGRENFFLELQFNKLAPQHAINYLLIKLARKTGIKLVATADSHYPGKDAWKARELYKRLRASGKGQEEDQLPESVEELKCELFPKNAEQMWDEYQKYGKDLGFYNDEEVKDAIETSHEIAHHIIDDVEPDTSVKLPSYTIPKGEKPHKALRRLSYEGLEKRGLHENQEYIDRLEEELEVIGDKGFSNYFLTMKAITDVAREHMLIGFGRGSSTGSLICYCLEITGIDPIEYDLLFSRFLSTARTELPDVDSDFSDRDRLRKLLQKEFGDKNVISISNINTMSLKVVSKAVAKYYGIEFEESNRAITNVDRDIIMGAKKDGIDKTEIDINLENALKYSLKFAEFMDKYPQIQEHIAELMGEQKALSRHAGGIILSENILDRMPVITSKDAKQTPWTKDYLEPLGWVKFDLLGLETLAIIERCVSLILQRHEGITEPKFKDIKKWFEEHLDPHVLDLNDQHVYEHVYHNGNYAGVFQVTTPDTQKFFMDAKPTSIIEIAALTSIYRPGPMGANVHKKYVQVKNSGREVKYEHPLVEKVLNETYGFLVFQEQAMHMGNIVGGLPLNDTDVLRKLVSKKPKPGTPKYDQALEMEKRFIDGAVAQGMSRDIPVKLYNNIKEFAKYSFNKSHAVSYAINSYICAWLLTYYESEWLCAYMETQIYAPDKKAVALSELKSFGYSFSKMDVNTAAENWTIAESNTFMPSLISAKGIGITAIADLKKQRPYKDLYNFLYKDDGSWRWEKTKFNKKNFSVLIKIGGLKSLDCIGEGKLFSNYAHMHRALIEGNDGKNWDLLKKKLKKDDFDSQVQKLQDLAADTDDTDWTLDEKLKLSREILGEVDLDLIISKKNQGKLLDKGYVSINEFPDDQPAALVWFVLDSFEKKKTKGGKPYLRLRVSGTTGKQEGMFLWNWTEDSEFHVNRAYLAYVEYGDFGFSTSMRYIRMI